MSKEIPGAKAKSEKPIQNIYSDALYWAMSPKTKDKQYHLTRLEYVILQKLIHYDKSDYRITYSNKVIGKHTFLSESQIEKVIPILRDKKYIKVVTFFLHTDDGSPINRRILNINWEFIKSVLLEVPKDAIEYDKKLATEVELVVDEIVQKDELIELMISEQANKIEGDYEFFTPKQVEGFNNFNPPILEWGDDHLRLLCAKDYVIDNANIIFNKCTNSYAFEFMINSLLEYNWFDFYKNLKDIDSSIALELLNSIDI